MRYVIKSRARYAVLALLVLCQIGWTAKEKKVNIVVNKPTAKTRLFDPNNRPSDMKAREGVEGSLCLAYFDSSGKLRCNPQKTGFQSNILTGKIDRVEVYTNLDIVIWLPNDYTQKQKDHEEGHRRIAERVYQELAEKTARQLGAKYVGMTIRKFMFNDEFEETVTKEMKKYGNDIGFHWLMILRSNFHLVNSLFDSLTDHGRNNLAEDDAIEQAFAVERKLILYLLKSFH